MSKLSRPRSGVDLNELSGLGLLGFALNWRHAANRHGKFITFAPNCAGAIAVHEARAAGLLLKFNAPVIACQDSRFVDE